MTNQSSTTRRQFIQTTALGAAIAATPAYRRASANVLGANERIGIGMIGCGGRGSWHLDLLEHLKTEGELIELVAACDVYRPRLSAAMEKHGILDGYSDYRELLANPNVDLVCIATPDHHHGQQSIDAIEAGRDVYCEKPVTHWRQFELTKNLARVAAASDCVFQLGTQAMSDSVWRQMKQLVREGVIGRPLSGETGFFRVGDWGERGMEVPDANAKPGKDLDWQAFVGDSPNVPFSVDRFFRWRLFEDYAGGPATDLYPHSLTQVVDVLGVTFPETVVATGGIHRYEYELRSVPDTFNLLAEYPEKITISHPGTQANDFQTTEPRGSGQRSPVIRGWEGSLWIRGKHIMFTPIREPGARQPQQFVIEQPEDTAHHWKNLLQCARSRNKETFSPMQLAYHVQTALQMAMLGWKHGKVAHFDAVNERIVL